VKTQGALPTEDAALILLFGLVVSGQISPGIRQHRLVKRCVLSLAVSRCAIVGTDV
jgi:hypothetical protein